MQVFVTGIGVVSAIGLNVEENYLSLKNSKSGIQGIQILPYKSAILVGEVKLTDEEIIARTGLKNKPYSRTSLLGAMAAQEAWANNKHHKQIRTGIISSSSIGGMDKTEQYYRSILSEGNADVNLVITHDTGSTTEKIAAHLGIRGYINTVSTACSSAANAIMLGARLLQQGKLDRVIVGGTDALADFTIKGFHSLMIYSQEWCKPFDENRSGLNLGEAAGFIVLENSKSLQLTGNPIYGMLSGWHNAADAYHQTASSPDGKGATLAMRYALEKAQLSPQDISYVNAHGTGTKNNDLSESVAFKNIFGDHIPPFSSTKAYTGHALAAAGAIEAVYSLLAIQHQVIFPNLNFSEPIVEAGLLPQTTFEQNVPIEAVMSNSFGFGGNNSSLIFTKHT